MNWVCFFQSWQVAQRCPCRDGDKPKPYSALACNTVPTQSPACALCSNPSAAAFWQTHGCRTTPILAGETSTCAPEGLQSPAWFAAGQPGTPEGSQQKLIICPCRRRKQCALDFHTLLLSVKPGIGPPSAPFPLGSQWETGRGRWTLQYLSLPQLPGLGATQVWGPPLCTGVTQASQLWGY